METPLFIATERFDSSDGERWQNYCEWARISKLIEVVSLDSMLCPPVLTEIWDEDWPHIVNENFRLSYFYHLDYLKQRVEGVIRRNVLGLYRNSCVHMAGPPTADDFRWIGYDLIEEQTQISALTNCGGFPDIFSNDELNRFGLIDEFTRASEIQRLLSQCHPEEPHAQCELYAIWRLNETMPITTPDPPFIRKDR